MAIPRVLEAAPASSPAHTRSGRVFRGEVDMEKAFNEETIPKLTVDQLNGTSSTSSTGLQPVLESRTG